MQHYIVLKMLKLDLLTPRVRGGGGSAGKIFATMLLHFICEFNLHLISPEDHQCLSTRALCEFSMNHKLT